jgi:V/A-type H+-transporting ATPase subunit I
MFFPEQIKRARFLVHESCKESVVRRLHELGAVQITDSRERLSQPEWQSLIEAYPPPADIRRTTTQLMTVNRLLDIFSMAAPEQEESFLKNLFAPSPPDKIRIEDLAGERLHEEVAAATAAADGLVLDSLARLEAARIEKAELLYQHSMFEHLGAVDVALEELGSGAYAHATLAIAPHKDLTALGDELAQATSGIFFFAAEAVSETETCLLIVSLLSDADAVAACLRRWDITRINPGRFQGAPSAAAVKIEEMIASLDQKEQQARSEIVAAAHHWRGRLTALRELLIIERQRTEIFASFARTRQVVVIEGWVLARQVRSIADAVTGCCSGLVHIEMADPDEPVEKLPVALHNPGIFKHFEVMVKLYATPRYDELDPTMLICPTLLLFFGIMISDAMYGLMTLLLGLGILRGAGRYHATYRSAGVMLAFGGVVTIVVGVLTGGWFGNLAVDYLGLKFLNRLVIINPMFDVSAFLLLSLGIGVIHIDMGILAGMIQSIRRRSYSEVLQNAWILFLEGAILLYYLKLYTAALACAAPALLLLLYSVKGMALFGLTGFVGDVLSYARLMAIGMVSFGLAAPINAFAKMAYGTRFVGWLLALMLLVGGHLFGFVLNLMGAAAHGLRLHFVELFGKFFSGGGVDFEPFRMKQELARPDKSV